MHLSLMSTLLMVPANAIKIRIFFSKKLWDNVIFVQCPFKGSFIKYKVNMKGYNCHSKLKSGTTLLLSNFLFCIGHNFQTNEYIKVFMFRKGIYKEHIGRPNVKF